MKRTSQPAALLGMAVFTIFALGGTVRGQIFNAEAGYTDSVTAVTGSPWTYGDKATPTSTATIEFDTPYVFPAPPPNGIEGLGDYGSAPSVEAGNDSRIQVNPAATSYLNFPAHTFSLEGDDTGAAHPDSFVRFTAGNGVAGSTGLFTLSVDFASIGGTDFTDYVVFTPALTGPPVTLFTTTSTDLSFTAPLVLAAGDTLDIVQSGDAVVEVGETLTALPEPSTWALIVGVAALLIMARRGAWLRAKP
jgi:hypothetical protein